MLGDETLWRGVLDRLDCTTDVRCLRSDVGRTVGEVAAAVLDAAPESFALAGHSFGGIVALEMQRQAPHRILRLALLSASARSGSPEQQTNWSDLRSRTSSGEFAAVAQELAVATLPSHRQEPELIGENLAMARAIGPSGLLRQLAAQATRPDSRAALSSVNVPTVVVIGQDDKVCPPHLQHEVASGICGSVTQLLPGVGHMSPLEAPDEVAAALDTWLSSRETTTAPSAAQPAQDPSRHTSKNTATSPLDKDYP